MSILIAWCLSLMIPEEPSVENITYTVNSRYFKIPIGFSPEERDCIDHLILYCSSNKGQTWSEYAKVSLDQPYFRFSAPRDGIYWFLVQAIHKDKTKDPADVSKAEPNLKVAVVTTGKIPIASIKPSDLEQEVVRLRAKVAKLEKQLAELKKQQKKQP